MKNKDKITLRPITKDDTDFLYQVYASSREIELSNIQWGEAEKEIFLKQQFDTQSQAYEMQYTDPQFDIVLLKGKPIGRLYVQRFKKEIRIIDIALLKQYRNKGIGTKLIKKIMNEAKDINKSVTLHVESYNPAMNLYKRLGFVFVEDRTTYLFLEWSEHESGK